MNVEQVVQVTRGSNMPKLKQINPPSVLTTSNQKPQFHHHKLTSPYWLKYSFSLSSVISVGTPPTNILLGSSELEGCAVESRCFIACNTHKHTYQQCRKMSQCVCDEGGVGRAPGHFVLMFM